MVFSKQGLGYVSGACSVPRSCPFHLKRDSSAFRALGEVDQVPYHVYVWSHIHCSKSVEQPGKVANLARSQLNREK